MTAETTSTAAPTSPIAPTSPPAKRLKTDSAATMESTASSSSNGAAQKQQQDQPGPLLIKKLSDKARLPTRGSALAAGYDLYAAHDTVIPARGKALVETDISMAVPLGTCKQSSLCCAIT
jgi:dUTPase